MLALLTLPVRPNSALLASIQQILERRPDLFQRVLPIAVQRLEDQTEAQIMKQLGIPAKDLLHTRAVRDWFEQGRQAGEAQGEARGRALAGLQFMRRPLVQQVRSFYGPKLLDRRQHLPAASGVPPNGLATDMVFTEGSNPTKACSPPLEHNCRLSWQDIIR